MSKLLPPTMLARASSKILTSSHRNNGRGTISSRKTNQIRKVSRISKGPLTSGRDSELLYNIDDGSMDEETDF